MLHYLYLSSTWQLGVEVWCDLERLTSASRGRPCALLTANRGVGLYMIKSMDDI
jgi:hypothetical protein